MSILHISIGGKSIFPSQRTSKQAYQTRHVPEKREQDQYGSQDTKAPLESHSSLRGTDKVPLSPPPHPPPTQTPAQPRPPRPAHAPLPPVFFFPRTRHLPLYASPPASTSLPPTSSTI